MGAAQLVAVAFSVLLSAGAATQHDKARRASFFDERTILELTVAAPFDRLFSLDAKSAPSSVAAIVSYVDPATRSPVSLDADVSLRGHTSRRETECAFPKLKLRFTPGPALRDSIFRDTRSIRIGTHCDDQPDDRLTFQFGRLANEKSPLREGLVYRLLDAAGVATLRTRPARITYVYGPQQANDGRAAASAQAPASRRLVRNALLVEDEADAMARLDADGELLPKGGEREPGDKRVLGRFETADRQFSAADSARVAFAEAMIGNFDWAVKFHAGDTYRNDAKDGLWNVLALVRRGREAFPLVYDFDLAGIVAGRHVWFRNVFPARFATAESPAAVEVLAQVQRTRSLFARGVLDAARREFLARKDRILAEVESGPVDEGGRENARSYLAAFFDEIASDDRFYSPVVARSGAVPFADASGSRPACKPGDGVPVGSPANRVGDGSGRLARVEVLDIFWHWDSARCDAIRRGPVWLGADAIEKDYPPR